jgi:predicted  nucleic acid-binding Zn ribbon protein
MKVAKIKVEVEKKAESEDFWWALNSLLGSLRMNGQIMTKEYPIARTKQGVEVFVNIPEADSLARRNGNSYVNERIKELRRIKATVAVEILGDEPESASVCKCRETRAYILFTNYISLESPVRCFKCFGPIPLYKIPKTSDGEYCDILSWQSDYRACDSLQMNCQTGVRFATNQLSKVGSQLTTRGISICRSIEKETGKLAYYYLYKYSGKSAGTERARKCPNCGGEWLLDEPLHGLFDFACDKCKLLSNIAWDVRDV